jgi:lambda family phage tail tape measure protein
VVPLGPAGNVPLAAGQVNQGGGFFDQLFSLFSAKGNAFLNGNAVRFANGGVVNGPTAFPMSQGRTGLMGENGPEAIMPLRRGSDGKLGVEGGRNVTIQNDFHMTFNTNDVDSFRRSRRQFQNDLIGLSRSVTEVQGQL